MINNLSNSLMIKKSLSRDTLLSNSLNARTDRDLEKGQFLIIQYHYISGLTDKHYKMDPELSLNKILTIVESQFTNNCKNIIKVKIK